MGFFCFFLRPSETTHLSRWLILAMCLSLGLTEGKSQDQFRKVSLSWKQKGELPHLHKLRLYESHTGELFFLFGFPPSEEGNIWQIRTEPGGEVRWIPESEGSWVNAYLGQNRLEGSPLQSAPPHHWVLSIPGDTFELSPILPFSSSPDSFAFALHRIYPLPPASPTTEPDKLEIPLMRISGLQNRPRKLQLTYLQTDAQISNLVQMVAILLALQTLFSP